MKFITKYFQPLLSCKVNIWFLARNRVLSIFCSTWLYFVASYAVEITIMNIARVVISKTYCITLFLIVQWKIKSTANSMHSRKTLLLWTHKIYWKLSSINEPLMKWQCFRIDVLNNRKDIHVIQSHICLATSCST